MGDYNLRENTIYVGDCKDVLEDFPDECVDLIYLDPPFFSNRNHEVIWEDGAELRAFEDRWKGGINQYIEWMEERIRPMYLVLKDTGSIYLHCDWHANYRLRKMMDDIFGRKNFKNEVIWYYRRWTNASKMFQRMHDTILFYVKTDEYVFNKLYQAYSDKTKHRDVSVDGKTRLNQEESEGVMMHDVWQIPHLHSQAKERLGYPTQKPKELLKRIIRASSNEGDSVLDPFCGCGTTIAVAEELNRNWIGIDVSPTACSVMRKRLREKQGVEAKVVGIPSTPEGLKKINWSDFQNWVIRAFQGRHKRKKR